MVLKSNLKRMKKPEEELEEVEFSSDDSEEEEEDEDMELDDDEVLDSSDEALQNAFAAGKLKPGLVVLKSSTEEDEGAAGAELGGPINDVPMLKFQLDKIKLPKKLGWIERLDTVNDVAPLAPEIAVQLNEHKGKRSREIKMINSQRKSKGSSNPSLKNVEEDPVHNDFVREMGFYRQAQEAVLKCLPRLKGMNVPTKRPDDYFAEMAKSDNHMQKVAQVLLKKQTSTERAEKVRKLREQKKFAKQTQVQVLQERQKAKKEMIENVKKYRKGQKGNLDFLDERKAGARRDSGKGKPDRAAGRGRDSDKGGKGAGGGRGDEKRVNRRRQNKNDKYGYGGQKKGSKWNTRDSLDSFDDGGKGKGGGGKKGGKGGFGRGGGPKKPMGKGRAPGGSKRPGKNDRQKMKARG